MPGVQEIKDPQKSYDYALKESKKLGVPFEEYVQTETLKHIQQFLKPEVRKELVLGKLNTGSIKMPKEETKLLNVGSDKISQDVKMQFKKEPQILMGKMLALRGINRVSGEKPTKSVIDKSVPLDSSMVETGQENALKEIEGRSGDNVLAKRIAKDVGSDHAGAVLTLGSQALLNSPSAVLGGAALKVAGKLLAKGLPKTSVKGLSKRVAKANQGASVLRDTLEGAGNLGKEEKEEAELRTLRRLGTRAVGGMIFGVGTKAILNNLKRVALKDYSRQVSEFVKNAEPSLGKVEGAQKRASPENKHLYNTLAPRDERVKAYLANKFLTSLGSRQNATNIANEMNKKRSGLLKPMFKINSKPMPPQEGIVGKETNKAAEPFNKGHDIDLYKAITNKDVFQEAKESLEALLKDPQAIRKFVNDITKYDKYRALGKLKYRAVPTLVTRLMMKKRKED
ncbi:MAG: hypothetical protein LBU10_01230 [Endomicrobium sp.]|jgi:hypothetical protein|nr:hypothetical protein [Endomicrobium sp.]